MKIRFFTLICVLALLLSSCGARGKTPFMYGLELIETLEEMIGNEEYYRVSLSNTSMYDDKVAEIRSCDLSSPKYACRITFDSKKLLESKLQNNISDEVFSLLANRASTTMISTLNLEAGTDSLAVASCFNADMTFECKAVTESMVYFYVYEGLTVAVSFTDGDGDSCSASAMPILNDALDTTSLDTLKASLEEFFPGCNFDVEKVY